jgi:hypothetical protein
MNEQWIDLENYCSNCKNSFLSRMILYCLRFVSRFRQSEFDSQIKIPPDEITKKLFKIIFFTCIYSASPTNTLGRILIDEEVASMDNSQKSAYLCI